MPEGPHTSLREHLPGMGVAFTIAAASWMLAAGHVALDPLILAILTSIIIANLAGPSPRLDAGITLARRSLIPAGIILYGAQMDLKPLVTIGAGQVLYLVFTVITVLLAVGWIARRMGVRKSIGLLLAAGSSICGASAIVVLAPVLGAKKEEISISLLAITVIGLTGVIIYPLAQELAGLPERTYALLCGSTLYQMGQVKAAAALVSPAVVDLAVPVKLVRVGMLLPVAITYSLLQGSPQRKPYVPWFIVGALAAALLMNAVPPLAEVRPFIAPYGTFLFTIAIAAIGLSVDLEAIIEVGPRPFLLVFQSWLILLALFVLGTLLIG